MKAAAIAAALLLLAAAAPAASALRAPKPTGTCDCHKVGGIPIKYEPVCGDDYVTYGNECVAKCDNVLIRSTGKCPKCAIKVGNCQCGKGYSPVCSFGLTFSTPCDAACGGYTCPMDKGVCRYSPTGSFLKSTPLKTDVASAARNTGFPSTGSARYSYTKGVHLSLIFIESMRSGVLDRQRLAWRSDSCQKCKGPSGEDLSKGYYEAGGSFLKLGIPEAFLVTILADSVINFPDGYKKSGDLDDVIDAVQWGVDYLVAAHSSPNRFVAVLGNDTLDFNYYGSVERYDTYVKTRTTCYIDQNTRGSEIAGEASAALAAAALMFKSLGLSKTRNVTGLITHSAQLYNLAKNYPGSYASADSKSCLGIHKRLYASTNGYTDELAWAAAHLFRATGTAAYRTQAISYFNKLPQPPYTFENGNKVAGLNVLMQQVDPSNAARYRSLAQGFFAPYLSQSLQHTPAGLAYPYHYGALRPTTQMVYLALQQSKLLRSANVNTGYAAQLFNYATFQINYILGDSGRAWLGGYSPQAFKLLWHKPSYNSFLDEPLRGINVFGGLTAEKTDGSYQYLRDVEAAKLDMEGSFSPQRFVPYGALYGAPLGDDSIVWGRKDYSYAEPTTDGNAAVTGALAALSEYYSAKQTAQNDCGLDLGWSHPGAKETSKSINNLKTCSKSGK